MHLNSGRVPRGGDMQRLIWVLWPSFIVAGVAEALFFTLVDPQEFYIFGEVVHFSPLANYYIGLEKRG